ncbi:MAG: ATP-binding protein [Rhizobiales bacterium]|nr:ATP-binding protein [Hyphomicrobiales bacterium]
MSSANEFLAALPDGGLVLASDGSITAANAHAKDMLQLRLTGLSAFNVIRLPAFSEAVEKCAREGSAQTVELEIHSRPPRLLEAHVALLGQDGSMLVVLRDLTREQQIERMRSDFVANASHEMRTPLTAILGTIETLQGPARDDPKARDRFFSTMLTQARRMKRLVDDLLTLSRIELNEHVRPGGRVDLADVARQARSNLLGLAKEVAVDLTVAGADGAIVAGDADELLQVAQNLIENALKYGNGGGKVEVKCETRGGKVVFSVRDWGKGIAEIHLPRLTERFYRVSTQESRARGGTGLGLAIVKHIVSRHRGSLAIESREGQGSTFSVSIPVYTSGI